MTNEVVINLTDASELGSFVDRFRERALEVLWNKAQLVVAYASIICPVRSGRLRDSIRALRTIDGAIITAGGGMVDYAAIVNAKSQFMDLAFMQVEGTIVSELEEAGKE